MMTNDKTQDHELAVRVIEGGALRTLLLDLWTRTRIDWTFASGSLSAAFREHRELGSGERRFVAETLYGMIRHLRRIDEALRAGGVRESGVRDDLRLIAYLVLEAGLTPDEVFEFAPTVDWRAVQTIDDTLRNERDAARRIARLHSFPDWLATRLVADLGEDAEAFCHGVNARAPMTIRVNTLKTDRDALAAELAAAGLETEPGRFAPHALTVTTRTNLFSIGAFKAGAFEAQDEGSQLIADLVAPPPRGLVVDFCAGAGGKTLALAAALENKGRVVACDVASNKLNELRRRARRAGATNVQAVLLDGESWPKPLAKLERQAARVLVDAPCSGLGALRRNPEARWRLTEVDVERLPETQHDIIEKALALVAPGGRLIYATCTVLDVENRNVVERILQEHSDLELVTAREVWGRERGDAITDPSGTFLQVYPHRHGTDGFFAAVLRRRK
jgi:16S rRNA (cytosine967-C5)-methyltransferase